MFNRDKKVLVELMEEMVKREIKVKKVIQDQEERLVRTLKEYIL